MSMFTIHQVRLGLATNSSSTHSLILLPGGASDYQADGEFGWNFFTCASKNAKLRYAAVQLRDTMAQIATSQVAENLAEEWTGVELNGAYIDHQSSWALPLDWSGQRVSKEFFEDLKEFLVREEVVILGGNDNEDSNHSLDDGTSFQLGVPIDASAKNLVCRKDEGYWVLFNRANGTKIRMSFTDGAAGFEPTKANTPELVDVKITDYCPFNCEFCYQDSTVKGEHADRFFLAQLAHALRTLKVFEVAIGGGEPTLYPDFVGVLESFRSEGIVPNFTTKNLAWLNNETERAKILDLTGAFAYSVERAKDLQKLATIRDKHKIPDQKMNCQYVMGSTHIDSFERLLEAAVEHQLRLTLLGYKTNGRGDKYKSFDYSKWVEVLKKVHEKNPWGLNIGIDTALAAEYQKQLTNLGVPKWCYEVKEGKFSMYIDAVAKKMAKSSYGPSLTMRPIKETRWDRLGGEITKHFAKM